jgi:hypothetical protein
LKITTLGEKRDSSRVFRPELVNYNFLKTRLQSQF